MHVIIYVCVNIYTFCTHLLYLYKLNFNSYSVNVVIQCVICHRVTFIKTDEMFYEERRNT